MRTVRSSGRLSQGDLPQCMLGYQPPPGTRRPPGTRHPHGTWHPPGSGTPRDQAPPCGQTDTCKNITFATSLRTVINNSTVYHWNHCYRFNTESVNTQYFKITQKTQTNQQECIPVGCVPPVRNHTGVSLSETPFPPWTKIPPMRTDKHLWKHNFCKLSLRAVTRKLTSCLLLQVRECTSRSKVEPFVLSPRDLANRTRPSRLFDRLSPNRTARVGCSPNTT